MTISNRAQYLSRVTGWVFFIKTKNLLSTKAVVGKKVQKGPYNPFDTLKYIKRN